MNVADTAAHNRAATTLAVAGGFFLGRQSSPVAVPCRPVMYFSPQIGGLVAIGLAAGVLGGLLGVGGGILMIPALTFIFADKYGPNSFHVYNLAAISTSFVLAIPAAIRHTRAGAVIYPFLRSIVPLAVIGVVAGVLLSTMTGERAILSRFSAAVDSGFGQSHPGMDRQTRRALPLSEQPDAASLGPDRPAGGPAGRLHRRPVRRRGRDLGGAVAVTSAGDSRSQRHRDVDGDDHPGGAGGGSVDGV